MTRTPTSKFNGILLINKTSGPTSHDVVHRVRQILRQRDIGHAGTLDPMAEGLMVLLLGEGTKLSDLLLNGDKGYDVTIQLGACTDTLDREGTIVSKADSVTVDLAQVQAAILQLTGNLELPVPKYSAVKIAGQKLYDYARRGEEIEVPLREMNFKTVDLQGYDETTHQVQVRMMCSKGSYVRAWAQALGENLGTGAYVQELTRWLSAPYNLTSSITLTDLEQLKVENTDFFNKLRETQAFVDLSNSMPSWPAIRAMGSEARLIENGVLATSLRSRLAQTVRHSSGGRILSSDGQKLLALIETDEYSNPRIRRVFRYNVDEVNNPIIQPRVE